MSKYEQDDDSVVVSVVSGGGGGDDEIAPTPTNWRRISDRHRETSRTIQINCWAVVVFTVACAIVLFAVLALHATMAYDRRVLLGTVLGVLASGVLAILGVARKDPNMLVTFSTLSSIIMGVCLGLSVGMA